MPNPQQKSNREHSFDYELACLVGIEKAILLKNISYWVDENERRKLESSFAYGKWWTFESLTGLTKKYPYMKRGNLSRWFNELKRDKWVLMFSTTNGANMYTPGPVFNSWNLGQDWQGVFQNETGRAWGEVFQNEPKGAAQNEPKGAAQNETHNNVEKDIENNVELEGERDNEKNTHAPALPDQIENELESYTNHVEAKKEKGTPKVAEKGSLYSPEIERQLDILQESTNRDVRAELERLLYSPTHVVKITDAETVPGALTTIVEAATLPELPKFYQPTNPEAAAKLMAGLGRKPLAETADEAGALIESWCKDNIETVKLWYSRSKRVFSPDDLTALTTKFCGCYSNHAETGKQTRFMGDPVLFFRNGFSSWLIEQKKYDVSFSNSKQKKSADERFISSIRAAASTIDIEQFR